MKHIKLKPSDTTVDHRYQRELDTKRVEAMARAYDPNLIGVPVISRRSDGAYVRIDGMHRIATAITAGAGDVPILMEVHEGLSLQEEATLFLRLNGGRKPVGAIDKYKARIEARDPIAMEMQAILKRLGCKICRGKIRGGIQAVDAVEAAFHKGNLENTLKSLVTWLDGEPESFDGELIRAVSLFFAAFPDADPYHLAGRLVSYSPKTLGTKLRRESQHALMSKADVARLVLGDIYNRRTPKARRVSSLNGAGAHMAMA